MSEAVVVSGALLIVATVLLTIPAVPIRARSQGAANSMRTARARRTGRLRFRRLLSVPVVSSGTVRASARWERRGHQTIMSGQGLGNARTSELREGDQTRVDTAVLLDLTGALLTSGIGIEAALSRLASSVPGAEPLARVYASLSAGSPWEAAWNSLGSKDANCQALKEYGDYLSFAYETGAPTVQLLEVSAAQWRAGRRQEAERRAARLGVQMVLPLGACFLPALILLGVIPVVLGLLPGLLNAV